MVPIPLIQSSARVQHVKHASSCDCAGSSDSWHATSKLTTRCELSFTTTMCYVPHLHLRVSLTLWISRLSRPACGTAWNRVIESKFTYGKKILILLSDSRGYVRRIQSESLQDNDTLREREREQHLKEKYAQSLYVKCHTQKIGGQDSWYSARACHAEPEIQR
jgi:hypothetical protein